MKSILHDLFDGCLSTENRRYARTSESAAINRKIESEQQYFMQKMSLDDCERFQQLEELYSQANGFGQIGAFSDGFRLGAALMCEVFMGGGEDGD